MKMPFLAIGLAASFLLPLPARAEEDSPLTKQMEALDDAYKAFRKESDPAKGAALAREAQDQALKSMLEIPELVKAIKDPGAKAKAEVLYRKMMAKMILSLCEVEEAFQANNLDEVAKLVDALKDQKKEGHDQFKSKDE